MTDKQKKKKKYKLNLIPTEGEIWEETRAYKVWKFIENLLFGEDDTKKEKK